MVTPVRAREPLTFSFGVLIIRRPFYTAGQVIDGRDAAMKNSKIMEPGRRWFQDARFGMFVHFGLYTLLGDNENAVRKGPKAKYAALMREFNPVCFSAEEWVDCAKRAGATYLCVTAKHADGFCLWDTKFSSCSVIHTPFKRDILREVSSECARQNIKFCLYYNMNTWLLEHFEGREFSVAEYSALFLRQMDELASNYGKVYQMWFDGCDPLFPPAQLRKAISLLHRKQPGIVVNDRGLDLSSKSASGDFVTPERHLPGNILPGHAFVECCDAIGIHSWGYKRDDAYWSVPELIRRLCRSASYGGNYLLNVGPGPDGSIDPAFSERMRLIGDWLRTNGRSIFGTGESYLRPSDPFTPGMPEIGHSTRHGRKFYLHLFQWPAGNAILLKDLKDDVKSATLLETGAKLAASWQEGRKSDKRGGFRKAGILLRGLPPLPQSPNPSVVELVFKSDVRESELLKLTRRPILKVLANEDVQLLPESAELRSQDGVSWHKICRYPNGRTTIGHMIRKGLECHWKLSFAAPGAYNVIVELGVFEAQKDAVFEVSIGNARLRGISKVTGWYDEPARFEIGKVEVSKGVQTVKLKIIELPRLFPDVHRILLQPG